MLMISKMSEYLNIANVLNKNFAVSQEDAQKVYPILENALNRHEKVQLSFKGMETCSTIFLRNTLGQLYLSFGPEVDGLIQIIEIAEENDVLPDQLKRLRERALNAEAYKSIFESAIGKA